MDDASTAYADAAVTMSRPKAADEHVGANWAAVGFADEVEVTRRGREAQAARDGGGVRSLLLAPDCGALG
jgi:hypothetical protein